MCNRAAITGYPTIRFYRGQEKGDMQDYFSEDIRDREQEKIVSVVQQLVKRSEGDLDGKSFKKDQEINDIDEDDEYADHENKDEHENEEYDEEYYEDDSNDNDKEHEVH